MAKPVRRPPFVQDHVPVHGSRHAPYICLHTTEGLGTVESYARYFRGTAAQLGSSFLIERSGRAGIYVASLDDRTYAVKNHNTDCISIEQSGFAATSRNDWLKKYRRQLFATAWTCAWLGDQLDIPMIIAGQHNPRRFTHPKGILQHADVPDNDHTDCGPGYPVDFVVKFAAKWIKMGGPTLATRIYIATGKRP